MGDAAVFRDMTEADLAAGLRLSRASGWNQTLEDWRLMLALGPGLFRVGVEDGRVVASGGAVRYGGDLAWICMILVDPGRRGRGLGTRVFDEVLGACRRRAGARRPRGRGPRRDAGRPRPLRAARVRGRPAARADEARGADAAATGAPARPLPPEPDGIAATRPMAAADLDAVLALDRAGLRRRPRGRAARRARVRARPRARGRGGGRVRGYCFGRHGDHSDHVGPVVAEDPARRARAPVRRSRRDRASGR